MRKIEQEMIDAILAKKEWSKSNTKVVLQERSNQISVFLHRTEIATFDLNDRSVRFNTGGHETVTTKSRINALIYSLTSSPGVHQKNRNWYIGDKFFFEVGRIPINSLL